MGSQRKDHKRLCLKCESARNLCEPFVSSSAYHRHITADFLPAAPGPEPVTTTEVSGKAPASADLFPTFSFPELGLAAEEEDSMAGYYAQHIQDINPFCGLVNIK